MQTDDIEVELQDASTYCGSLAVPKAIHASDGDDLSSIHAQAPNRSVAKQHQQRQKVHASNKTKQQRHPSTAVSIINELTKMPPSTHKSKKKKPTVQVENLSAQGGSKTKTGRPPSSTRSSGEVEDIEAQIKKIQDKLRRKEKQDKIKSKTKKTKGDTEVGVGFARSIWSKNITKITILLFLYALIISGLGGWLLQKVFKIPGLMTEIDDLSEQIYTLQLEVDRLEGSVDRLGNQIDLLSKTNSELEETKEKLHKENMKTKDLVTELNSANEEFNNLTQDLERENLRYIDYNRELNQTVKELVEELDSAVISQQTLKDSIDDYIVIKQTLEQEVSMLSNTAGNLNSQVEELNEAIEDFRDENTQLRTIVSFLEDEANGVQQSYDELADALADTIIRKRALVRIALEERMKAELAGWECGLLTAFDTHQFAQNVNLSIGNSHYDDVIAYVDDKLLSDFCIETGKFESYLKDEIITDGASIWTINLKDLTRGVNIYSSEVLNYYFSDEGDTNGLDGETWEIANYDCSNLSQEDRYTYSE